MEYSPPTLEEDEQPETLTTVFVREAIVRYRGRKVPTERQISTPQMAVSLARRFVHDEAREHFTALYLDSRHRPIAHSIVSVGTATASLVHPREVFQAAVLTGACALLVLHNHPSGDVSPSSEDRAVTKRLADAGALIGIRLLDSIVWTHGDSSYTSLQELEPSLFETANANAGASIASPRSKPRPMPEFSID